MLKLLKVTYEKVRTEKERIIKKHKKVKYDINKGEKERYAFLKSIVT